MLLQLRKGGKIIFLIYFFYVFFFLKSSLFKQHLFNGSDFSTLILVSCKKQTLFEFSDFQPLDVSVVPLKCPHTPLPPSKEKEAKIRTINNKITFDVTHFFTWYFDLVLQK